MNEAVIMASAIGLDTDSKSVYTRRAQLKIVYLFLSLEEKISNDDLEKLTQFASQMKLSKEDVDYFIKECEDILSKSFDLEDRFDVVRKAIFDIGNSSFDLNGKEAERIQCLWLLVNCAYYDGKYSLNERKLLRNISREWKIRDNVTVLSEMEDTAETILDLVDHKKWIKTTNYSYDYIDGVVKELDKNQQELAANISLMMSIG
jgi:hypothetical protein